MVLVRHQHRDGPFGFLRLIERDRDGAVDGRRAARRPVKLGLKGDGRVEVIEGVAPDDALVSAANGAIKAGQRVRAVGTAGASAADAP